MEDSTNNKEEFSDLIQQFVEFLAGISDRLPFEIDHQRLYSITTFAVLSVAIIFTWKLLRASSENHRRQSRRRNSVSDPSGARLHSTTIFSSPEICSSSGDSKALDAVDELFRPVKLTLEQLIRHKLCEGRKVTCQLVGIILEETSPEELQQHATVRSSVCEVLLEITKFCDLYLMERILDDESEPKSCKRSLTHNASQSPRAIPLNLASALERATTFCFLLLRVTRLPPTKEKVLSALGDAGLFTSGGLTRDKVLFCSTENGRSSFVRQLEPDWHIDTNIEIIHQLSRFIKYLLHISPNRSERAVSSNVFSSTGLKQFFGGPDIS